MPESLPKPDRSQSRRATAFALFGFGGPLCLLAFILFRLVFMPGKFHRPPIAEFRLDRPLPLIACGALVLGAALLLLGNHLLETDPGRPRDFGSGPGPR